MTVDGQPLKMKRHPHDTRASPFAWGETSVGAERLAYSILADCLGDGFATLLSVALMNDVVRRLDPEWEITSDDIEAWQAFRHDLGYTFQAAAQAPRRVGVLDPVGEPIQVSRDWPRLVDDPNYRVRNG